MRRRIALPVVVLVLLWLGAVVYLRTPPAQTADIKALQSSAPSHRGPEDNPATETHAAITDEETQESSASSPPRPTEKVQTEAPGQDGPPPESEEDAPPLAWEELEQHVPIDPHLTGLHRVLERQNRQANPEHARLHSAAVMAGSKKHRIRRRTSPAEPARNSDVQDASESETADPEHDHPHVMAYAGIQPDVKQAYKETTLNRSEVKQYLQGDPVDPSIELSANDVPYIYVIAEGDGCPEWFKLNMRNTLFAQRYGTGYMKPSHTDAHETVLIEGGTAGCADFCTNHGIVHHTMPAPELALHWELIGKAYPKDKDIKENLWLQSVIRYFMLHLFLQKTALKRFIYLDWDTVVYVPSHSAWRLFDSTDVKLASCVYPPVSYTHLTLPTKRIV
eukprot:TRINITY_DN51556_c0_g1_i2.p1 TRINITY_DN51556_c0_g1~~TRINITY_DN51556_c0_g1_i2.p1  ORF type:complete len:392 (+),score=52.53 TRINITY_DN51556_c0_g1_i2:177-1352(+)